MIEDPEAWESCDPADLWFYDKLILSRKLGYICGPVGVDVPKPGNYIVRPCVNLLGMGRGALEEWIEEGTDHLPVGHFWCEKFEGQHLSIDYVKGKQVLAVEGIRKGTQLWRWDEWRKVDDKIPYPSFVFGDVVFPVVNIEFIAMKLIEVHFRSNPDFRHGGDTIFPRWEGGGPENEIPPPGFKFVSDKEYKRVGFFVKL